MIRSIVLICLLLSFASPASAFLASAPSSPSEEFVGPFANWVNVTSASGCSSIGNGTTDATTCLQNALNGLGSAAPVVYFPAGTYLISGTLIVTGQQYVSIIGQDPATVSIVWNGLPGGTMLELAGVAYSRVNRITFNGMNGAGEAVDQSWSGSGNYFDSGNEYADDIFENVGTGLGCGNAGHGCAETTVLRGKFLNNSQNGVETGNGNALDMWVWYSLFSNDAVAVGNNTSGNPHVFESVFENSTTCDFNTTNTGIETLAFNYSTGSKQFICAAGSGNPDVVMAIGNTVVGTTQSKAVNLANLGPLFFAGNIVIQKSGNTTAPIVNVTGGNGNSTDVFSYGNYFTTGSGTCTTSAPAYSQGHCHEINDTITACPGSGAINCSPSPPILPSTPSPFVGSIIEVGPGASTSTIQSDINTACTANNGEVVHLQAGSYSISSTLNVGTTSTCAIKLIGDGGYTTLTWTGTSGGTAIQCGGTSGSGYVCRSIFRDFQCNGSSQAGNCILISNADQAGARVWAEELNLSGSGGANSSPTGATNLYVNGVNATLVELHDFLSSGVNNSTFTSGSGVSVVAGSSPSGSQVNIFTGTNSGNFLNYALSGNSSLLIEQAWTDAASHNQQLLTATGPGTFTYANSTGYLVGTGTALGVSAFTGRGALININMMGSATSTTSLSGSAAGGEVLADGLIGIANPFFSDTTSPADTSAFWNGQTTLSPPSGQATGELSETCVTLSPCPSTASNGFLTDTLNQILTTKPTLPTTLGSGITDARLYRVYTGSTNSYGIQIAH